jgi:hypothetical protein
MYGGLDQIWSREAAVAGHRMDQLVADAHLERPIDERDELDRSLSSQASEQ